jgi:RNA polymerase sigma factor (sigma-70 family)
VVEGRPPESDDRVAAARRGDVRAFEDLVQEHQQIAFRTAYLVCGDAAEARDVVQEACVRAWRALGRFREGAPFRPWLLTIVANEARNRRRSAGRRAHLAVRAAAATAPGDAAPSPEAALVAAETREQLLRAVSGLPDHERRAIECRYLLGLDEAETAAVLDCARGTVKSRTSRGLERLRATLEPEEVR